MPLRYSAEMADAGFPGTPKAQFLGAVRQALGRVSDAAQIPYGSAVGDPVELERQAAEARQRIASRQRELLEQFAATAALRSWKVFRAPALEDALGYVTSLAVALSASKVVRSNQEVFAELAVDAALQHRGVQVIPVAQSAGRDRAQLREEMASTAMGITGADYAVAETGSVVVLPRRGLSRLVSVVPPVHVALVRPQEVVASLDDVFLLRRLEYYRRGGDMGSYLNFITGPSRTADIEQTLVVGVHGPKEVHLVLLG